MSRPGHQTSVSVPWPVPTLLSFVAGYVDACTFLALFGLFVAQVTGSFVVVGAQLVASDHEVLVKVLAIPAFFVAAVVTTVLVKGAARSERDALPLALGLELALLVGFLGVSLEGAPFRDANAPLAVLAALLGLSAMGVQSALVRLLMQGYASTNVMTTNTTQLAIDVAELVIAWWARRRRPADTGAATAFTSARSRCGRLFSIVLAFLVGTGAGALGFVAAGLTSLLAAIGIVLALCLWAIWR